MQTFLNRANLLRFFISIIAILNVVFLSKLLLSQQGTWSLANAAKPAYIMEKHHTTVGAFNEDAEDVIYKEAVFLEWNLVDVSREGHFEIETYQQFEIHRRGKDIVNKVATPHYQYLRYWIADE